MGYKIVADDYGMTEEINNAISDLVAQKIVSKTSVMANESVNYSKNDMTDSVETGLHVNLTLDIINRDPGHYGNLSPLKLIYLIYSGKMNISQIIDNIDYQSRIVENRGFNFSYIDTHHHVHIIPRVLDALIDFAGKRGIDSIRCITIEKKYLFNYIFLLIRFGFFSQLPKMIVLYFMGFLMKSKLDRERIKYCKNLVLLPLAVNGNYAGLFKELLKVFQDKDAEFVVHPGYRSENAGRDSYCAGRYTEYLGIVEAVMQ